MSPLSSINKIKIAYIIPTLNYGGAEKQLIELCRHLSNDVFEPTIILLKDRDRLLKEAYRDPLPVKVIKLKNSGKYNFLKLFELIFLLKRQKPNIIHSFLPTANFWGGLAARLSRSANIVIASSRGLHSRLMNKFSILNFLSFHFLSDLVLVNSETVKNNCINVLKINSDKISRIYNFVTLACENRRYAKDDILTEFGIKTGDWRIISTAGRLDYLKGIDFFVEMASGLRKRRVNAKFLIAGAGPRLKHLKTKAQNLSINKDIRFLGELEDIEKLFFITDIFVLPTLSEGCSNVILEAMTMGLPVVTTSIEANKELIENHTSGLLVEPKNPDALAEAVLELINNPDEAKTLGENARRKVESQFSTRKIVKQYEQLYRQVLGEVREG